MSHIARRVSLHPPAFAGPWLFSWSAGEVRAKSIGGAPWIVNDRHIYLTATKCDEGKMTPAGGSATARSCSSCSPTGARISEIVRLDRSDWALERLTVVGKGDKERVVTVTARARDAGDEYLAARRDPSPASFIAFSPRRAKRRNRATGQPPFRTRCPGQSAHRSHVTSGSRTSTRIDCAHTLGTLVQEPRIRRRIHQDHRGAPTGGEGQHRGRRLLTTHVDHHSGFSASLTSTHAAH
jgi:hypothetical protein